jgi:DNA-binding NarL/FixJ family response regulator
MQILFGAGNGLEVIEKLKIHRVDVLLLDLNMPIMEGTQTLQYVREHYPGIHVLILSSDYSDLYIRKYMQLGARGYLSKDFDYETILDAIRSVYQQGFFFHDKVSRVLLAELIAKRTISIHKSPDPMSNREIEIIHLICREKTNFEIGQALSISVRTVQNHRLRINKKTGAKNAVGILVYALKNGLYHL